MLEVSFGTPQKKPTFAPKLLYLLGLVSLFLLPALGRLTLAHLFFTIFALYLISWLVSAKLVMPFLSFLKKNRLFALLALLYFISTSIAAVKEKNPMGLLASLMFLGVFWGAAVVYFMEEQGQNTLFLFFLRGFCHSAVVTSFILLVDVWLYRTSGKILLQYLPTFLTTPAGEHVLINTDHPLAPYLSFWHPLRPAAFSWDPGLNIPALVIAFVVINEGLLIMKYNRLVRFFLLLGIFLSFSKTSVIACLAYLLLKGIFFVLRHKEKAQSFMERWFPLLLFLFLFHIGFFFAYEALPMTYSRHLKYLGSVVYLVKTSVWDILFGFGYRRTGYFLLNHVPWFQQDKQFDPYADIESLLTNVFLWGGAMGSLFWLYSYVKAYMGSKRQERLLLLVIMFLSFGYNFHTVWFLFFYLSFLWHQLKREEPQSGV
ncbi:MAG: hypothetical protein NZM25_00985 [Leptospiraceae bacterium]|nr:hypothetical protein [Leptospiraceae bacterium]MDW8306298.1 hypothetical protein [Leptospiraceae bacterium]